MSGRVKATKITVDLLTLTATVEGVLVNGTPVQIKSDMAELVLGTTNRVLSTFKEKLDQFLESRVFGTVRR